MQYPNAFERRYALPFAIGLLLPLVLACSSPQPDPTIKGAIVVSGTINHVAIEGGCWLLQAGDKLDTMTAYLIEGDDIEEILVDGAKVTVQLVPRPNAASFCQMGIVATVVKILKVELPDDE